jgi:hypothetical protein
MVNGASGIHVWAHPDASARTKEAATALENALKGAALEHVQTHIQLNSMLDAAIIHLMVGTKL